MEMFNGKVLKERIGPLKKTKNLDILEQVEGYVIRKSKENSLEHSYDVIAEENGFTEVDGLELTEPRSNHERLRPPMSPPAQPTNGMEENMKVEMAEFGELIDFRGLRHAPVNENGVIFLFGMVSHELGFMVNLYN